MTSVSAGVPGHHVTSQHEVETSRALRSCDVLEDRPDRRLSGGRSDPEGPAGFLGFADEPWDPGPRRDLAGGHHLGVDLRLAPVPCGEQRRLPGGILRQVVRPHEARRQLASHPLLAAADLELATIVLLGPVEWQPELAEGLVEGWQMAVALGVGEHAVAVEDERAHALPSAPNSRM